MIDQVVTSGKPCLGETELPQYGRLQLLCGEGCDQRCPGWKWFEKRVWERFLLMKDDWILILFITGWAEKVSQNKTVGESKCTASWSGLCKKTDQDGLLNAKKVLYTQKRVQSYKSRKCYYESAEMGSLFWSEYWSHFRKQSLAFNLMCICESDFVCNCALRLLHRNVAVIFNYNVPSASNEWVWRQPKFTFSHFTRDPILHMTKFTWDPNLHITKFTRDPNLHNIKFTRNLNLHKKFTQHQICTDPNLHKNQIYTDPKLTQTQFYTKATSTHERAHWNLYTREK